MQLPIVAPAPIVTAHADIFRDLLENRCQFRHFQPDLTGLIVLANKSLAHITRCGLERADKTNLSRFFSAAPWFHDHVNDRRVASLLQQPQAVRGQQADAILMLDETLGEPVGKLFDSVDRHDDHGDDTYPLAHHPVTRHDVRGPVCLPLDLRVYRRDEARTHGEGFVRTHCPDRPSPTTQQERARRPKAMAPVLLDARDFQQFHQQCRTKIALGLALVEAAIRHKVPGSVLVCARWYLADALVAIARYHTKDWGGLLKKNRHLETNSVGLQEAAGQPSRLAGPPMAVEDLVPLLPPTASRAVTGGDTTSWTLTLAVRLPGLGQVRLGGSFKNAEWTGTYGVLVSHRGDGKAQRLLTLYGHCWPLATFYQDGTGHRGVDAYRMRNAEAMQKHWWLVCVASSLVHLEGPPSSPTKGSVPVKTMGEACRRQARALIEGLIL